MYYNCTKLRKNNNFNINLGISGFGIGVPNNLCCIQTIQITIQITDAGKAFDSSADDNDGDVSLTRSVPGQFDEPDLMLDSFSRVVCGDGATSLHSDEWQDGRIKQKDFLEKVSIFRESITKDCAFACKHMWR